LPAQARNVDSIASRTMPFRVPTGSRGGGEDAGITGRGRWLRPIVDSPAAIAAA
jgi:hypothetical protein